LLIALAVAVMAALPGAGLAKGIKPPKTQVTVSFTDPATHKARNVRIAGLTPTVRLYTDGLHNQLIRVALTKDGETMFDSCALGSGMTTGGSTETTEFVASYDEGVEDVSPTSIDFSDNDIAMDAFDVGSSSCTGSYTTGPPDTNKKIPVTVSFRMVVVGTLTVGRATVPGRVTITGGATRPNGVVDSAAHATYDDLIYVPYYDPLTGDTVVPLARPFSGVHQP